MNFSSGLVQELVNQFVKLPGIGKRTATRMVLNLIKQDNENIIRLSELIQKLTTDIRYCKQCHNITENEVCNICSDHTRDHSLVCVVEDLRDVLAIEQTQQFRGVYHVLGGVISPLDGVKPEDLHINSLIGRIRTDNISELVFALRATMEGDTTMFYIARQAQNEKLKISAISRGISIGGELEYADEITLGKSIANRIPYNI